MERSIAMRAAMAGEIGCRLVRVSVEGTVI